MPEFHWHPLPDGERPLPFAEVLVQAENGDLFLATWREDAGAFDSGHDGFILTAAAWTHIPRYGEDNHA